LLVYLLQKSLFFALVPHVPEPNN